MPLHLKPTHISMIGVAVTGVGVIAAIYYYRHMQAASDGAQTSPTMGSYPYFQTAAVPSGAGSMSGDGASVTGGSTGTTDTSSADLSAILSAGTGQGLTSFMDDLMLQQNQYLADAGHPSNLTTGYIAPAAGGGFNFGLQSQGWDTNSLNNPYLFTPGNLATGTGTKEAPAGGGSSGYQQVITNSTGSKPSRTKALSTAAA